MAVTCARIVQVIVYKFYDRPIISSTGRERIIPLAGVRHPHFSLISRITFFLISLALIMARKTDPIFVGIAFDSGGVASGPMTSTFLLPMAIGACTGVGGNITTDAFGVVALVALAPIIAIQATGLLYVYKSKQPVETEVPEDTDYEIIELEEE